MEHNSLAHADAQAGGHPDTLFASVDDIVELLVVHPDELVHVELNSVLKDPISLDVEAESNSTAEHPVLLVKEEAAITLEPDEGDDAGVEAARDDSSEETFFLEKYNVVEDIIELPKEAASWGQDPHETETVEVLYECSDCLNTFMSENEYLSHTCPSLATQGAAPSQPRIYECELCDRVFRSHLVYQMHVGQHKNANLCHVCNATFLDHGSLVQHICEDHPQLSADLACLEELGEGRKQCDICGKITHNLKQHKMYHTIKELEFCKEKNKRTVKKWFLCKVSERIPELD